MAKNIYDFSKIYLGDIVKVQSNYNNEDNLEIFKMVYRFSENQELNCKLY